MRVLGLSVLQPGKRQEPTVANLFVDYFIPRCHVITWPPRDRFLT